MNVVRRKNPKTFNKKCVFPPLEIISLRWPCSSEGGGYAAMSPAIFCLNPGRQKNPARTPRNPFRDQKDTAGLMAELPPPPSSSSGGDRICCCKLQYLYFLKENILEFLSSGWGGLSFYLSAPSNNHTCLQKKFSLTDKLM